MLATGARRLQGLGLNRAPSGGAYQANNRILLLSKYDNERPEISQYDLIQGESAETDCNCAGLSICVQEKFPELGHEVFCTKSYVVPTWP